MRAKIRLSLQPEVAFVQANAKQVAPDHMLAFGAGRKNNAARPTQPSAALRCRLSGGSSGGVMAGADVRPQFHASLRQNESL